MNKRRESSLLAEWNIGKVDIARVLPIAFLAHWPPILCILAITILLSIDAGEDILVGIMEVSSPEQVFLRLGMIFFGLIIYSLCIWLRPLIFIRRRQNDSALRRFLAVMPCFIVGAAIFRTQFRLDLLGYFNIYWGLSFLLIILLASVFFRDRIYAYVNLIQIIFIFSITLIALFTGIYINKSMGIEQSELSYHLFGVAMAVLGIGLFHFYKKIDQELFVEGADMNAGIKRFYYGLYFAVALVVGLFIATFTYFDHIHLFHPIFVFLISFSFYTIIFNSINALYDRSNYRKVVFKNFLILFMLGVLIYGFAYPNYEHHKVDLVPLERKIERISMDEHMIGWLEAKVRPWLKEHPRQNYPLYLISGEGGGSRAGFWFTRGLLALDSIEQYRFKDHVYAISTVSGSSVGAAAVLAFWQHHLENIGSDPNETVDGYAGQIFSQNYLSSSIYSLLIPDFFKQLFPLRQWVGHRDRNYWLQQEEAFFIEQALRTSSYSFMDYVKEPIFLPKDGHSKKLYRPYLTYYYDQKDQIRYDCPMVLTNSTMLQRGNRAIVSPVKYDDDQLVDAFDVLGFVANHYDEDQSLSLGEAANISELFPFFSASAVLGDSIALGDGGYFENLGLTAISEIKDQLEKKLATEAYRDIRSRVDINIIVFRNSTYLQKRKRSLTVHNQLSSPINALYNSGVGGRTEYLFKKLSQEMGSRFHTLDLDHESNDNEKLLLPLNRFLSDHAVETMDNLWKNENLAAFEIE